MSKQFIVFLCFDEVVDKIGSSIMIMTVSPNLTQRPVAL